MTQPKNKDVYSATIKLFGSQPEPAFETKDRMESLWGRNWGCDNDVGRLHVVLMHRPGDEFKVIDPSKRIEETSSFGDLDAGWYWQSETIPPLAEIQAQHDALADTLRAEGVEVVYLEGVEGGRFKSVYTRDSSFAVKGGAIVGRLAPRMRHGEELTVTRTLAKTWCADSAHRARHRHDRGRQFRLAEQQDGGDWGAASGSTTKASPRLPRCSRFKAWS